MDKIGEVLRKLRGSESLRKAANRAGISHQYLKYIEDGVDPRSGEEFRVSPDVLRKVGAAYGYSYEKLLELAGYLPEFENVTEFETKGMVSIPVVGVIHGGPPHEAREEIIGYRKVDAAEVKNDKYFFLRVVGNSMRDMHIVPDSSVLVRRQNYLDDGQVGVFLINGNDATVKKFRRANGKIILSPANPDFDPQIYSPEEVKILGRVVKVEIDL